MTDKFNKDEAAHEIIMTNLTHKFALKMAILICVSAISTVVLLGLFFGALTGMGIVILLVIGILFGIVSFAMTRSACMI